MSRFKRSTPKSKTQSKVVAQFMSVTYQGNSVAERILKMHRYKLEPALEYYYNNQHKYPKSAEPTKASMNKLEKVFDKYAGNEKDCTSAEGLQNFFKDIDVDLSHRWSLYIAFLLKSTQMSSITRKQFTEYFGSKRAFTISEIKKTCTKECRSIDKYDKSFAEFYVWLFSHVKENEDKRSIPKDFAITLWSIVLPAEKYPLLPELSKFAKENKDVKAITLDTWTVVREFLGTCKDPKTFYNDGAWPMLVDQYLDAVQLGTEETKEEN